MAICCASRRLIFLRHALQIFGTRVIAVNCNVLIRQRWAPSDSPLMLLSSESSPFWEDVFAGFIYATPGGVAKRYFDGVARFIEANLISGNFAPGLEQVALSAGLDTLAAMDQLAVSRPERTSILDSEYAAEAFCWLADTIDGPSKDYKASLIQKFQR